MKRRGFFHHCVTSLVLMSAAAIALKGFFLPEQTALLLRDTGLVPFMYTSVIAFALPLALSVCILLAGSSLTTLAPVVGSLALFTALSGLALYQGLHFDCGCYPPGSVESEVYSKLEPHFIFLSIITAIAGGLHLFNLRFSTCTTVHTA